MGTFAVSQAVKAGIGSNGQLQQPFGGLLAIMNEANQIIAYRFVANKGRDEMIAAFQGLKRRFELQKREMPLVAYTDNCCADRKTVQAVFPDIAVRALLLPLCLAALAHWHVHCMQVKQDVFHVMARYLNSTQGAKFDSKVFETASRELHDAFFVKGSDGVLRVPQPPELEKAVSAWVAKFQVAARARATLATISLWCR